MREIDGEPSHLAVRGIENVNNATCCDSIIAKNSKYCAVVGCDNTYNNSRGKKLSFFIFHAIGTGKYA
jgi:hypothetical protein